jgi:alcohol dehydrogenase class IV
MDGIQMYSSLKDFGIDATRFEKMADDTIHLYGKGRPYLENPKRITKEGIIEILTRSLEASDR